MTTPWLTSNKAFITSKQTELEIKYPNLQPILALYDKDPAAGDRSHLDAFFPDLKRKLGSLATRFCTFIIQISRKNNAPLMSSGMRTRVSGKIL